MKRIEREWMRLFLGGDDEFDESRGRDLGRELVQAFEKRRRRVRVWTWSLLAVSLALMLWGIGRILSTDDSGAVGLGLVLFIAGVAVNVTIKMWYWQMDTKLGLMRELKRLQIQLAEHSGRERGE